MENLERRFCEFELRSDGNRLVGTGVRYGDTYKNPNFHETIERGAFTFDDVIMNIQHDRNRPIARTNGGGLEVRNTHEALEIEAVLPDTPMGIEALAMVRAGLLRGFSVEMRVDEETWQDGPKPPTRTIHRARLVGVGVVDIPAYPDSKVAMRNLRVPELRLDKNLRPYYY